MNRTTERTYAFHEYADLFPMLDDDALAELTADVRSNGLLEAIVLYEGKILDGRNRYLACREAKVEPRFEQYRGNDALQYVVSKNLHRRHLNSSQRAAIALDVLPMLEAQARKRQVELAGTRPNTGDDLVEKIPEGSKGRAREQAAAMLGTNPRYVSDAKKIKDKAPDLLEEVRNGNLTIGEAKNELKRRELRQEYKEKAEAVKEDAAPDIIWNEGSFQDHIDSLRDGTINVILTDPPYGMDYQSHRRGVLFDKIENDSPQSATAVLREALSKLKPKLADDAHVLVFCTWRNEHETMEALRATGYRVIGSLVWIKDNHGSGNLQSGFAPMHERIVHAIKGAPALLKRIPDVLYAKKVSTDIHPTEKPVTLLKQLIEVTCPEGGMVADPFGGVGSTLEAAKQCKRAAWGCELVNDYYVAGKARLYAA